MASINSNVIQFTPSKESFRILPRGTFETYDGRTDATAGWFADVDYLASMLNSRSDFIEIDYNHASFNPVSMDTLPPAAGWIKKVEARDDGLYASEVEWTEKASAMIDAKEALYISPALIVDNAGRVLEVLNVALVNNPAIKGLTRLAKNENFNNMVENMSVEDEKEAQVTVETTGTNEVIASLVAKLEDLTAKIEALSIADLTAKVEALSVVVTEQSKKPHELPAIEAQGLGEHDSDVEKLSRERERICSLMGIKIEDFNKVNNISTK